MKGETMSTHDFDFTSHMAATAGGCALMDEACPACGEQEFDSLVWDNDGEMVECQTCKCRYQPGQ
jgi:hypothetical protein